MKEKTPKKQPKKRQNEERHLEGDRDLEQCSELPAQRTPNLHLNTVFTKEQNNQNITDFNV